MSKNLEKFIILVLVSFLLVTLLDWTFGDTYLALGVYLIICAVCGAVAYLTKSEDNNE